MIRCQIFAHTADMFVPLTTYRAITVRVVCKVTCHKAKDCQYMSKKDNITYLFAVM